jgi:hypothetical protein
MAGWFRTLLSIDPQFDRHWFLVLVWMQPGTVHRFAVVVEDVLTAIVGAVDGPGHAIVKGDASDLHRHAFAT